MTQQPEDQVNYPRLFLLIGGFFGLLMLVITPPFQTPDEHDHFFRAVMISSGQFVGRKYPFSENQKKQVPAKYLNGSGGIVPISIPYTTRMVNQKLPFHPENKQSLNDLEKMFSLPLNMPGQPDVFTNTSAAGYSPILYLPSGLAITVGWHLKLSPLWLMYLGRLANLLAFLGLAYWALKITPTGKIIFFLLALMPMSLFLAPSLSIDGLTIASSMLLTATLLNLARNGQQPVTRQAWLIVPGTLTLLALAVISYLLWRQLKGMATVPDVTNIPFDYTSFQTKDKLLPLLDRKKQLQFLQHYPGTIFTILNRTLQVQGQHYIESFIGLLGWLDTKLPVWIYISYPLALIVGALGSHPAGKQILTETPLLTLVWALCSGGVLLGFYLLSTPVGNAIIGGIQGRYFIPVTLPLLLIFSASYRSPMKIRHPLAAIVMKNWPSLYAGVVLLTTTYTLWGRYY